MKILRGTLAMVAAGLISAALVGGAATAAPTGDTQQLAANPAPQKTSQPAKPSGPPPLAAPTGFESLATDADAYRNRVIGMKAGLANADVDSLVDKRDMARYDDDWATVLSVSEKLIAVSQETWEAWMAVADAAAAIDPASDKALQARWLAAKLAPLDKRGAQIELIADHYANRHDLKGAAAFYRISLLARESQDVRAKLEDMETGRIRVVKTALEAEQDPAAVCFTVSGKLAEPGTVQYEDYVAVTPKIDTAVYGSGDTLCVEGLVHGQSFDVTLRQGLPGRDRKLLASVTEHLEVPDRSPRVGFKGSGLILPRVGSQGLPLVSVNVERAHIKVLRINDRNLIHFQQFHKELAGYQIEDIIEEKGELVWQGVMDIQPRRNKQVTTAIPLGDVLGQAKPGIYVVIADRDVEHDRWDDYGAQWVVVSDLGLHIYNGQDGLSAFTRSFASGKAVPGAEVTLVARNNEVLASAKADAQGVVRFDPGLLRGTGGRAPQLLMAYGKDGDFSFLDLTQPAFDLSDRGVGGREAPGPLDAFLYTDRGIYRPGETVHLMVLLRDDKAVAVEGLPLTLKLLRPDGVEVKRYTVKPGTAGAATLDLPFSDDDRTGPWTLNAFADPNGAAIGTVKFQIEDFIPSRMEVLMQVPDGALAPGKPMEAKVTARFLYGAPAAGLAAQGELILRQAEKPFPDHAHYSFGLAQETFEAKRFALKAQDTDADGNTLLVASLGEAPDTSHPLEAVLRASVVETSGRATDRSALIPVRTRPLFVGIRPTFEGEYAAMGSDQGFEVIAVDTTGQRIAAPKLSWTLYEERVVYNWYRDGSSWTYRYSVRDQRKTGGTLAVGLDKPAEVVTRQDWGGYRLEIRDAETGAATSFRYHVGWATTQTAAAETPDKLKVASDKSAYRPGETARINVSGPFAGELLLTVARQGLVETRQVVLPAGGTTLELPVTEQWGTGAYVTATAFRPGTGTDSPGPARAVGLVWAAVDPAPRTLKVSFDVPSEVKPRQTIQVPIKVEGASNQAFVTLAAVDEGILMLTDFASPNPAKYYYGKRRLAVELRDSYGKLIDPQAEARGTLRSGGDAASRHAPGLQDKHIKPLSLFSGIVALDAQGMARIPIDLPDFNGRVRLMAVAYDADKVGQAEAPLLVRAPLVLQASLPRFLAPGDQGTFTLAVDNIAAAPGKWRLQISGSGAVQVADGDAVLDIKAKTRLVHRAQLSATAIGSGKVSLVMVGPDGTKLTSEYPITSRPLQAFTTQQWATVIPPGGSERIDGQALAGFLPGSADLTLSLTTGPNFDLPGLLKSLDRYPYGCVEQTTSRALPLLYLSDLAASLGGKDKDVRTIASRVQAALDSVVARQSAEGGFSLWGGGDAEVWLSAYAMDFLLRARDKGYQVPGFAVERGLRWLKENALRADYDRADMSATVYAMHVLARAAMADPGALRYTHDAVLGKVETPIARAHLASALSLIGDRPRADGTFASIALNRPVPYRHYGSGVRDAAAFVTLAAEAGYDANKVYAVAEDLARRMGPAERLSTQEKAWLTLAAYTLMQRQQQMAVDVDGAGQSATGKPVIVEPSSSQLAKGFTVRNTGDVPIHRVVSVSGVPKSNQPAVSNGLEVSRTFYTLDGEEADLGNLTQNDVLLAVIEVTNSSGADGDMLVVDLLPAGFEIENSRLAHARTTEGMSWVPELTDPDHMEFRDDRFIAAFTLTKDSGATTAYLVRAVTPGTYGLPAVLAEDMYRPEYNAREEVGVVTVLPRK